VTRIRFLNRLFFFHFISEGEFLRKTLLTLDTFTTPATFLDKLIERYEGPKQRQLSAFEQNLQAKTQKRVCSTLKSYIINRAPQDLATKPELVAKIRSFIATVEKDSKYLAKDLTDCLNLNVGFFRLKFSLTIQGKPSDVLSLLLPLDVERAVQVP